MKNIKKITIVLENCQEFTYKASDFGEFAIEKIEEKINRTACNCIGSYKFVDGVTIELFARARKQKDITACNEEVNSFERIINHKDITQFILTYSDNKTEVLYVDYDEENNSLGAQNKNQRCMLSNLGNLYIIIDSNKNKTFKDYFNLDKINDTDYMGFREDLISID